MPTMVFLLTVIVELITNVRVTVLMPKWKIPATVFPVVHFQLATTLLLLPRNICYSENMSAKLSGYTLIELLVVLSIMSILGIAAYINSKNSIQDQAVKNGASQIQTYLRTAQSNANSSLQCYDMTLGKVTPLNWYISFGNQTGNIVLNCGDNIVGNNQKNLPLDSNVQIISIAGTQAGCSFTPSSTYPIQVYFSTFYGKTSFKYTQDTCISSSPSLTITIAHKNNLSLTRQIIASSGGSINVQ